MWGVEELTCNAVHWVFSDEKELKDTQQSVQVARCISAVVCSGGFTSTAICLGGFTSVVICLGGFTSVVICLGGFTNAVFCSGCLD